MRVLSPILTAVLVACGTGSASAQPAADPPGSTVTVGSLLAQDYAISGVVSTPSGGAGLFMLRGARLYFCFVTETRRRSLLDTASRSTSPPVLAWYRPTPASPNVKAEYNYMRFGQLTEQITTAGNLVASPAVVKLDLQTAILGINYRF
jgi:hypothetical protein